MTYLVTGGSGYVGSRIVRRLVNANKEVISFDPSGVTLTAREVIGEGNLQKVRFIEGDISEAVSLFNTIKEHDVRFIIHTASLMARVSDSEPAKALRINNVGFSNVLEAARFFNVKRVVWTSSTFSMGDVWRMTDEPMGENPFYKPVSVYSATKALNEFVAKHYFEKFGVDNIGLRFPMIFGITFGPNRSSGTVGAFGAFLEKAARNVPVKMKAAGWNYYIYVEDAAAAHVKACDGPTTKRRIFNVAVGRYSNQEVMEVVRRLNPEANATIEDEIDPRFQDPMLDLNGLEEEIGWKPEYSLEAAIKEMFNYYRQEAGMPSL